MVPWESFSRWLSRYAHNCKQDFAQIVFFHQLAELTDGGLISCGLPGKVKPDKPCHQAHIIQRFSWQRFSWQRFSHGRVRQIVLLLQKVGSQHGFDGDRTSPYIQRLGIILLEELAYSIPGNDVIPLPQKDFPAGVLRGFSKLSGQKVCWYITTYPFKC